jgi:hypothetical protein
VHEVRRMMLKAAMREVAGGAIVEALRDAGYEYSEEYVFNVLMGDANFDREFIADFVEALDLEQDEAAYIGLAYFDDLRQMLGQGQG